MKRNRQRWVGIPAALLLLALAAAPTAAAQPGTESWSFSQSGRSAEAWAGECTDNGGGTATCAGQSVFAFAGKTHEKGQGASRHSEVCVSFNTDTYNYETDQPVSFTYEWSCAATDLDFDDLSRASISPTLVTLQGETCTFSGPDEPAVCTETESRTVLVEGTFTGTGSIVRQSYRSFYDDGVCAFRDSSSGYERSASFDGTVDGSDFSTSDAFLREGNFSTRTVCSLE